MTADNGDLGSMNTDPVKLNRHLLGIALQVICGPLSMRINTGCPCEAA